MPGFEIGQRKTGFYSERTESQNHRQTDRITEPSSTVLVYRFYVYLFYILSIYIYIYYMYIFYILSMSKTIQTYGNKV